MCDAFLANYAAQINTQGTATTDLEPTVVLFTDTQCGGLFYPESGGQVPTNPYIQGQTIQRTLDFDLTPQSLYIPFDFFTVTMESIGGLHSTFLGPAILPNLSLVRWQQAAPDGSHPTMTEDGIATITFSAVQPWTSSLFEMCMGETKFVGEYPLSRFYPQSERCDLFMSQQFCNNPLNQTSSADACACLIEEPAIEAESQKLGVTLPVVCFGEKCATTRSYKTNNMMSQPCNLTICQQIISSTPNIINQGQDTIFCGGEFYKAGGVIVAPSVTPFPLPANPNTSGTPFFVWIMLGVSAALFAVLVILLFLDRSHPTPNVLRQVRKLHSQRRVYNLSNPTTQPVETDATAALEPWVDY